MGGLRPTLTIRRMRRCTRLYQEARNRFYKAARKRGRILPGGRRIREDLGPRPLSKCAAESLGIRPWTAGKDPVVPKAKVAKAAAAVASCSWPFRSTSPRNRRQWEPRWWRTTPEHQPKAVGSKMVADNAATALAATPAAEAAGTFVLLCERSEQQA